MVGMCETNKGNKEKEKEKENLNFKLKIISYYFNWSFCF